MDYINGQRSKNKISEFYPPITTALSPILRYLEVDIIVQLSEITSAVA